MSNDEAYLWYCPATNELIEEVFWSSTMDEGEPIVVWYQDPKLGFQYKYYYYIGEL